jgi:L-ascorbate metabolism protein UlaG (beta-lactamase superfamily)
MAEERGNDCPSGEEEIMRLRRHIGGVFFGFCAALLSPQTASAQDGKVHLLWLGQASFRLTTPGGKNIMIDPWVTQNPKTPAEWKNLEKLGKLDLVLVSHAHGDHFGDAATLVKAQHIQMWGPAGLADTLAELGILTSEEAPRMNKGGTITPLGPGIAISETRADHSSEFVYVNPETKKREVHVGGEPVGFIIKLENGFTIYHMGDTNVFSDMKLIASYYKPDLILVPIGGHFVMDPKEAALATKMVNPKYAIPIHYGTIPQLKGTPEEYLAALGKTKTKVIVMTPGETTTF